MSGRVREVILSRAAIDDLREIGAYIARDNPERADAFIDELERRCRELGTGRSPGPRSLTAVPMACAAGCMRVT
jgi:plasmid stabilization system protein ParE